jgi:hypothetical protein
MRYQLRLYRVKEGELDDWIAEWRDHVLPLRRAHGFEVLGPWIVRGENRFVWIVGHEDFEAADEAYYKSPDRRAVEPDPVRHLAETQAWLMDPIRTDS